MNRTVDFVNGSGPLAGAALDHYLLAITIRAVLEQLGSESHIMVEFLISAAKKPSFLKAAHIVGAQLLK